MQVGRPALIHDSLYGKISFKEEEIGSNPIHGTNV